MTELVVACIMAALTALTIVAYKHPHHYPQIAHPIGNLLIVALIAAGAWDLGTVFAGDAVYIFIDAKHHDAAQRALVAVRIGTPIRYLIVMGALAYLGVLGPIGRLLNQPAQGDGDAPDQKAGPKG